MATTEFIAAIELGSSKITGVAGKKNSDGSMQVLAYAQEDSSTFIRKGVIFNLDKTAQSLTSIINRLEGEFFNSPSSLLMIEVRLCAVLSRLKITPLRMNVEESSWA